MMDVVSAVILLFILILIISFYNINKPKKRYIYLISAFSFIFISFLFKILSHYRIYYYTTTTRAVGAITYTYQTLNSSETLVFLGMLFYHIIFLLGLYLLYATYLNKQSALNVSLVIFLLILVGFFSTVSYYFIFYVTSLILLGIITHSFYEICKKNKLWNTKLLVFSFTALTISQLFFIFIYIFPRSELADESYILAEIIQLMGYLLLLFTFLKVLRDGKKKG